MTGHKIVQEDESGVIPMSEMKPCQWAVIVEGHHNGVVILRDQSSQSGNCSDMSNPDASNHFVIEECQDLKVRPIPSGTRLTIEIT